MKGGRARKGGYGSGTAVSDTAAERHVLLRQIVFWRFLRTSAPTSADGIEKYLLSGMIRGVGPVYAKKLVRAFGEKVFDIIEATPDRLREVDGIGPVRAASILAAWDEQKAVREIMVFLHSHGRAAPISIRAKPNGRMPYPEQRPRAPERSSVFS